MSRDRLVRRLSPLLSSIHVSRQVHRHIPKLLFQTNTPLPNGQPPRIPSERRRVRSRPHLHRFFSRHIASERPARTREKSTRTETLRDRLLKGLASVVLHPPEVRIPLPLDPRVRLCRFLFEPETDLAVPEEACGERHHECGRITCITSSDGCERRSTRTHLVDRCRGERHRTPSSPGTRVSSPVLLG